MAACSILYGRHVQSEEEGVDKEWLGGAVSARTFPPVTLTQHVPSIMMLTCSRCSHHNGHKAVPRAALLVRVLASPTTPDRGHAGGGVAAASPRY